MAKAVIHRAVLVGAGEETACNRHPTSTHAQTSKNFHCVGVQGGIIQIEGNYSLMWLHPCVSLTGLAETNTEFGGGVQHHGESESLRRLVKQEGMYDPRKHGFFVSSKKYMKTIGNGEQRKPQYN